MTRKLSWLALACFGSSALFAQTSDKTLEKLRSLRGDWEGTYTWSGGRNASGKMRAQYYITGNGSAVVENLISDGVPAMTSVYHLDGTDLRVTHFCAAGNQPRLKATTIDSDGASVTFSLVDITNLRTPASGHVEGIELKFLTPDHVTVRFRFTAGGKKSGELVDLTRKK